jgi:thiamine biosynthesis lipoprotein
MELADEAQARQLLDAVAACAWRIDDKFSRYRTDNVVARINASRGEPIEVDDETAGLLDFAALVHELSDGLFDITSGVLRKAWTFDGGVHVPSIAQIAALLPLVGWSKVRWLRPRLTLLPGMQVDFGGIGKEYAVDQAVQAAAKQSSAAVLVNFGGDLAITRARSGERPWRVGVEGIEGGTGRAAKTIELMAGALATSGDTYRFVMSRGERLSHILDPRDGYPVRGAPRLVTVAAPTCTQAGMLATLAMLRGAGAEQFMESQTVRHWIQR